MPSEHQGHTIGCHSYRLDVYGNRFSCDCKPAPSERSAEPKGSCPLGHTYPCDCAGASWPDGAFGSAITYPLVPSAEPVAAGDDALFAAVARAIYDAMRDHDPEGKHHPWTPGGNSIKQDEARSRARAALAEARGQDATRGGES